MVQGIVLASSAVMLFSGALMTWGSRQMRLLKGYRICVFATVCMCLPGFCAAFPLSIIVGADILMNFLLRPEVRQAFVIAGREERADD